MLFDGLLTFPSADNASSQNKRVEQPIHIHVHANSQVEMLGLLCCIGDLNSAS